MDRVSLDYSNAINFIDKKDLTNLQSKLGLIHNMLHDENGENKKYLGWVNYPKKYNIDDIKQIDNIAQKIKNNSDIFIIIGIGGSYLGARAAIEMLSHNFYNELPAYNRKGPKIYYVGHNISPTYLKNLFDIIDGQNISINVISKSGTTIEPMVTFRLLKEYMQKRYDKEDIRNRIYITTDKNNGSLREIANKEGYETLVIPEDIGGRYSVLTPVGLLPMAVAGIDIKEVLKGAQNAANDLENDNIYINPCYKYAAIRNILYSMGKTIEVMVNYEPNLFYFGEWFKQLFGESEGKDAKGIFPTTMNFVTDLHSMGQYIQEGKRNIFETILNINKSKENIIITGDNNLDKLNYLNGVPLDFINKKAMKGAISAHVAGGVPNLIVNIPEISPYYFGYLVYFFKKACAMSGYLLGVNPFDQPGVEIYKKNMFTLLSTPPYEQ